MELEPNTRSARVAVHFVAPLLRSMAAKAELYAQATGHRVLRLVNLSEGGVHARLDAAREKIAAREKVKAGA